MQALEINLKRVLFMMVALFAAVSFTACGDDDEPQREDFIQSYYDGTYTVGSAEHILNATLNGVPVTSSSASATFRSSDMKKATITVSGILSGGTKKFDNVQLVTDDADGNVCSFELREGDTLYGTGSIAGTAYGASYVMTLTLSE